MGIMVQYEDIKEGAEAARNLRQHAPKDCDWTVRLGKITRAVRLAAEAVEDDLWALNQKFGKPNDAGDLVVPPADVAQYQHELRKFWKTEIELGCEGIKCSEWKSAGIPVPAALDFLILED